MWRVFVGEYLRRNLSRWSEQLEASKTGEMPTMDRLLSWLRQHLPSTNDDTQHSVTLIHGDYRSVMIQVMIQVIQVGML